MTSATHFSAGGGRLSQLRAALGGDPDNSRKLPPATAAYAFRLMPPRTIPEGERSRTTAGVLLHSRTSSSMPMRFGRTTHQSACSCRVLWGARACRLLQCLETCLEHRRENRPSRTPILAGRDSGALCCASTYTLSPPLPNFGSRCQTLGFYQD